jgi:hypothetical protein
MVLDNSLAKRRAGPKSRQAADDDGLPFLVEVWAQDASAAEVVVARVRNYELARTAFDAAVAEHAGRRVTVRRRDVVFADSQGSDG